MASDQPSTERLNPLPWIQELDEYLSLSDVLKDELASLPSYRMSSMHIYDDPEEEAEEMRRVHGLQLQHFRQQVEELKEAQLKKSETQSDVDVSAYVRILEARISEWLGFDIPDEGDEDYSRWQEMNDAVARIETVEDAYSVAETYFGDPSDLFECIENIGDGAEFTGKLPSKDEIEALLQRTNPQ